MIIYRDKQKFLFEYHAAVNTNNGTEALNKILFAMAEQHNPINSACALYWLSHFFLANAHQKDLCLNIQTNTDLISSWLPSMTDHEGCNYPLSQKKVQSP